MKSVIITIGILCSTLTGSVFAAPGDHNHQHIALHHGFDLPNRVVVRLSNQYPQFDLIHTSRIRFRGRWALELLIQQGNTFVQVHISENGRFYNEARYHRYPLRDHFCTDLCSFQYRHYHNGHFNRYDPFLGCDFHINLISGRNPVYRHHPYYGYGYVHYNHDLGIYKRFRHARKASAGYAIHGKSHPRNQGGKHYRYGYRKHRSAGRGHDHGISRNQGKDKNSRYDDNRHSRHRHHHLNQRRYRKDYQKSRSDHAVDKKNSQSRRKRG